MTRSFSLLYSVYSTRKRKNGLKEVTIMSATKCATDDVSELFPAVATPPFEDLTCLENYWGRKWGQNCETGTLRMVMLHRPDVELNTIDPSKYNEEYNAIIGDNKEYYWIGKEKPDIAKAAAQHDAYAQILKDNGVEIVYTNKNNKPNLTKTINCCDVGITVPGGMIVCRNAPYMRKGEACVATKTLGAIGMPILRTMNGTGVAEGGNCLFLDDKHACIGLSTRTNLEGIRQVREILDPMGIELIVIPCPGYMLHIDGMFAMIDHREALVDVDITPYFVLEKMKELGINIIKKDPRDDVFVINCVPLGNKKIVMQKTAHSEYTKEILREKGYTLFEVEYDEAGKAGGGLHCATLPLIRDYVDFSNL